MVTGQITGTFSSKVTTTPGHSIVSSGGRDEQLKERYRFMERTKKLHQRIVAALDERQELDGATVILDWKTEAIRVALGDGERVFGAADLDKLADPVDHVLASCLAAASGTNESVTA